MKLYYAFRTPRFFYLVMEYLPGGDLHSLLKAFGVFDESASRVYAAEIVLALEYLHSSKERGERGRGERGGGEEREREQEDQLVLQMKGSSLRGEKEIK